MLNTFFLFSLLNAASVHPSAPLAYNPGYMGSSSLELPWRTLGDRDRFFQVSAAPNGEVWAIGIDHAVHRYLGEGRWGQVNGPNLRHISVSSNGVVWGTDEAGIVHQCNYNVQPTPAVQPPRLHGESAEEFAQREENYYRNLGGDHYQGYLWNKQQQENIRLNKKDDESNMKIKELSRKIDDLNAQITDLKRIATALQGHVHTSWDQEHWRR